MALDQGNDKLDTAGVNQLSGAPGVVVFRRLLVVVQALLVASKTFLA